MNVNVTPYPYNPARMLAVFTIPADKSKGRKRLRKKIVAPEGLDREAAIKWARRIEHEVWSELMGETKKENTPEEKSEVTPTKRSSACTLQEFFDRFEREHLLAKKKGGEPVCKPATRKGYYSAWRTYFRQTIGNLPIDMINRESISPLRKAIGDLCVTSRNGVIAKLRVMLETAESWGLLKEAPILKREKMGKEPPPKAYSEEESQKLIDAAQNDSSVSVAIVLLGLRAGLRVSEMCALRWGDLDLDRRVLIVRHNYSDGVESTPKGGSAAPVGLAPDLIVALSALPRRADHVLVRTYKGEITRHTPHSITWLLHTLQETAGIEKSGPHRLRHTYVTSMARRGAPAAMLQKAARHARLSTTERYIHLVDEEAALAAADFWATAQAEPQVRPKRRKPARFEPVTLN